MLRRLEPAVLSTQHDHDKQYLIYMAPTETGENCTIVDCDKDMDYDPIEYRKLIDRSLQEINYFFTKKQGGNA